MITIPLSSYSGAALYDAIATGNSAEISKIANSDSRPNFSSICKENSEENLLIVCGNNTRSASILLNNYSDEISVHDKSEAFILAVENDNHQVVKFLLNRCNTEITAEDKGKALWLATVNGYYPLAQFLLNRCNAEISADYKGKSLEGAISDHDITELLLDCCCAAISANYKIAALNNAVKDGSNKVVKLLLKRCGTEITADDKRNAFMFAVENDNHQVVEFLLNRCGAEITADDKSKVFMFAVGNDKYQVVKLLLNCCNTEITAEDKGKALWLATVNGYCPLAQFLLNRCNAEISADYKGKSLEGAVSDYDVTELLLDCCDTAIGANYKIAALNNAAKHGNNKVIKLLLKRCGAEISGATKNVINPVTPAVPAKKRKKLLCIDFDDTMVNAHYHNEFGNKKIESTICSNGVHVVTLEEREQYKGYVNNSVIQDLLNCENTGPKHGRLMQNVIRKSLENGHAVAITSYTLYPEVMVPTLEKIGLNNEEIKQIHLIAGFPNGFSGLVGKKQHMDEAMKLSGVHQESDVILLDDSSHNIFLARFRGFNAVQVPPEVNPKDTSYFDEIKYFTKNPVAAVEIEAENKVIVFSDSDKKRQRNDEEDGKCTPPVSEEKRMRYK